MTTQVLSLCVFNINRDVKWFTKIADITLLVLRRYQNAQIPVHYRQAIASPPLQAQKSLAQPPLADCHPAINASDRENW